MIDYEIKKGTLDDKEFVTISYKDRRITKPLILGIERFFEHWDELAEFEKNQTARRRIKK